MAEHYVIDMRHFEGFDPTQVADPRPVERMIAYAGSVVEAGTASQHAGGPWASALPCPRRPARRKCGGYFLIRRQDVPPQIEWHCPLCGESGVVTGWHGSSWDLTPYRDAGEGADACEVELTLAEHAALLDDPLLSDELRAVLRAGELSEAETVYVRAARDAWTDHLDEASALQGACTSPTRAKRLARAVERIEVAVRAAH